VSGEEVRGSVSPHLTMTVYAAKFRPWSELLEEAKERLKPYYTWAAQQARQSLASM
jgi:hypothetical protein